MYERTSQIERQEESADGVVGGILVTDGEASDGHILNIKGGEIPPTAPLLFGHDDFTGTGNLGSWTSLKKFKGDPLGGSGIRGTAQIELGGEGSQQAWRADVNHMIDKGHIGAFSVRWEETSPPIPRVNLPSDHPAFLDAAKAKGRARFGLFFEKWRLLEGSVVTLGADPAALIGRMQQSTGDVRTYWRETINRALEENFEAGDLVGVKVAEGEVVYVERSAYEAMLSIANERLQIALDVHEKSNSALDSLVDIAMGAYQETEERSPDCDDSEELEREEPTATLPVEPEPEPERVPAPGPTAKDIAGVFRDALGNHSQELTRAFEHKLRKAQGRVSNGGTRSS